MPKSRSPFFSTLRVVDLGTGMAGALVACFLAQLGAQVTRIEPEAGDPFHLLYPAYPVWHAGSMRAPRTALSALLAEADICLCGGEDLPGLDWRFDPAVLRSENPGLIVLAIGAYLDGQAQGRPAVDLLVQARTGLAFEHYLDRPLHHAFAAPSYGAALQGLFGVAAALVARQAGGAGQVVATSLEQGAAMWVSGEWMSAEHSDARFDFNIPKGVRPLVFQCADGGWIHVVTGTPGSLAKLYAVLGIDQKIDPAERGLPNPRAGLNDYFGPCDLFADYVRRHERGALLEALWREGIAAEAVCLPGEAWDDPQVALNGIIETAADTSRSVGNPLGFRLGPAAAPRPATPPPPNGAPLAGLRVIDLGTFVAGPYGSRMLADLGADVIKVEPPSGCPARLIYRTFHSANAGKRSICIDMKTPDGLALVQRLCASADIVHYNYRPGVAERLGVGPDELARLRPGIVSLATLAYGARGPKAQNSGFDMIMQALCGHEARNAGPGNPPVWERSALVDYAAGALSGIGLLVGLLDARATGHSVSAELNLLDSGLWMMSELVQDAAGAFAGAPPNMPTQTGISPYEAFYRCADGWVGISARGRAAEEALRDLLGVAPAPGGDEALAAALASSIATHEAAALASMLEARGIWVERCEPDGWRALAGDTGARRAGGMLATSLDPRYGRIDHLGQLVELHGAARAASPCAGLSPGLGANGDEILAALGCNPARIAALRAAKVLV